MEMEMGAAQWAHVAWEGLFHFLHLGELTDWTDRARLGHTHKVTQRGSSAL